MPNTMTLISAVTVGAGGAANIEFTSIPNTYTDLLLKWSGRSASGSNVVDNLLITYNNNTTNYTQTILYTDGSVRDSVTSSGYGFNYINGGGSTANTFSNCELYIPNYAGSTNKVRSSEMITENNGASAYAFAHSSLWSNSSAITSIKMEISGYNHAQHSTAYLYGIVKQ